MMMTGSERLVFSISGRRSMKIQRRGETDKDTSSGTSSETGWDTLHPPPGALVSEASFRHAETGKGHSGQIHVRFSFARLCLSKAGLYSTSRPRLPSARARQHSRCGCRVQSQVQQEGAAACFWRQPISHEMLIKKKQKNKFGG